MVTQFEKRPIEEAPRDGSVVLTNEGFACFLIRSQWAFPVPNQKWALCYPCGNLLEDSDDGIELCNPTHWTPFPDWIC